MPGSTYTLLAEVANERYGFVTPSDARELGINPMNLVRMAERGQIERRGTGLYRFPLTPPSRLDTYMEATLWPRGARGILSHETALELYELSDVHPANVHITVPRGYRVRRRVPPAYRLHHEDLEPDQVTLHEGIAIVTPTHAIRQANKANYKSNTPGRIDVVIDRAQIAARATGSLRLEGLEPTGPVLKLAELWVRGDASDADLHEAERLLLAGESLGSLIISATARGVRQV